MKIDKEVIIRKARSTDVTSVYAMMCELEGTNLNKSAFLKIWRINMAHRHIFYITAVSEGKVVGFASVHIQNLLHHAGEIAEVQELVVRENLRGLGIGRRLLRQAKRIAVQGKCKSLELACNSKRRRAHGFYEREGMERTHYKFTQPLHK